MFNRSALRYAKDSRTVSPVTIYSSSFQNAAYESITTILLKAYGDPSIERGQAQANGQGCQSQPDQEVLLRSRQDRVQYEDEAGRADHDEFREDREQVL